MKEIRATSFSNETVGKLCRPDSRTLTPLTPHTASSDSEFPSQPSSHSPPEFPSDSLCDPLLSPSVPKLTNIQTFFTLLKGFLGTGILFLPNGFSNGGWAFSICAILGSMLITFTCGLLLIEVAERYKGTFSELGMKAGGLYGKYICDLVLALSQAGFVVVHITFISQNLNAIFEYHWGFTINIWIIGLIFFFIYTPLCWIRKIESMSRYHLFGDLTVILAIFIIVLETFSYYRFQGEFSPDVESFNSEKYLVFLGTAVFIFEGVGVVLPVREACGDKKHFTAIFTAMMLVLAALLILFGGFCYAVYGEEVLKEAPMVTKVLRKGNIMVEITMGFLFVVNLVFSYPLVIYPTNEILESYFIERMEEGKTKMWVKNLSRAIVVFCTFFIGIYFEHRLDRVLSVVGSLTCTPVAFIMPAVFHLNLVATTKVKKIIDYTIIGLGVSLLISVTGYTILNWN